MMGQTRILSALLQAIEPLEDHPVTECRHGRHLVAVKSRNWGISSWSATPPEAIHAACETSHDSARLQAGRIMSVHGGEASFGMACLKSLLPAVPDFEIRDGIHAADLIRNLGKNKAVAVVGHFPFVDRLRSEGMSISVLEKRPGPGDFPASQAPEILPSARLIAITASALTNGTLAQLLSWKTPDSTVLLIGPSLPLTDVLFSFGIDILAGAVVEDPEAMNTAITNHHPFKGMPGVRHVVAVRPGFHL